MDLKTAIQQSVFNGLSDADVLAAGKNPGNPIVNSNLQTVAAIVEEIGEDAARLVMGTMRAAAAQDPLVDSFYIKLNSYGEDWSNTKWQSNIDTLAAIGNWPSDTVLKLKAMGVKPQTIWQNFGFDPVPTIEDIAAARAAIANEQAVVTFLNECLNTLISDPTKTLADIKAAVAAYGV
jgi:hypothetical protein